MRRLVAFALLAALIGQSSGGTALAASSAAPPLPHIDLAAAIAPLRAAVMNSLIYAALTGQAARYAALHAPPPLFDRHRLTRAQLLARLRKPFEAPFRARSGTRQVLHFPKRGPREIPKDRLAMRRSPVTTGHARGNGGRQTHSGRTRMHANDSGGQQIPTADVGAGIAKWFEYEEHPIPGVGKALANIATGNLAIVADDSDVPERGIDLAFRRVWNSQSLADVNGDDGGEPAVEGNGWSSWVSSHLVYRDETPPVISYYNDTGFRCDYTGQSNGTWKPCAGEHAKLYPSDSTDCDYIIEKPNGVQYYYRTPDSSPSCGIATAIGVLYQVTARNGDTLTLTYSWTSLLHVSENLSEIDVAHSDGQTMTLTYGRFGTWTELASIARPDGAIIKYHYDNSGNLIQVDKPGSNAASQVPGGHGVPAGDLPETYTWNGSALAAVCGARATIALWNAPNNPQDGGCEYFTENTSQRVTSWWDAGVLNPNTGDGSGSQPLQPNQSGGWVQGNTVTFSGYSGNTTSFADTDGHATKWHVDGSDRVTETDEWNGSQWLPTDQSWDADNNLTSTTDANGNETDYGFDARGNTVELSLPRTSRSPGVTAKEAA